MAMSMASTAIITESRMNDTLSNSPVSASEEPVPAQAALQAAGPAQAEGAQPPRYLAVLDQLAALYPHLFGEVFMPLKRGIFQDILAAHPELFERDTLKVALAFHTRSTRYQTVVASGQQRHDLLGQAVEELAPEHVHHALLEVFRRRQNRSREDLRPKLRERIIQVFEASGLSRADYAELVRSRDEATNALLEEALVEAASRAARDEALLRAFEASGQSVESFAEMYAMNPRQATLTLERGRRRRG
jgi:ProP effector